MDPSLFRVLVMKEPGEASNVDSSFVLVRVCARRLLFSIVLSSSVLDADAEGSLPLCEYRVRLGCNSGEWTWLASKESLRDVTYSGVTARIVACSDCSNTLPCLSRDDACLLDLRCCITCGLDRLWPEIFTTSSPSCSFIITQQRATRLFFTLAAVTTAAVQYSPHSRAKCEHGLSQIPLTGANQDILCTRAHCHGRRQCEKGAGNNRKRPLKG